VEGDADDAILDFFEGTKSDDFLALCVVRGQLGSYDFFECISRGRRLRKTTADPSTSLRYAQDDTI
jgi:hypothetical protein